MREQTDKRQAIGIELSSEAREVVNETCERFGMKKKDMVTRVLRWFSKQDTETKALVLDQIPSSMVPMAVRAMLERWVNSNAAPGVEDIAHIDTGESPRTTKPNPRRG